MALPLSGISWSTTAAVLFLLYINHTMYTMYKIYNPEECRPSDAANCLNSAWTGPNQFKHQLVLVTSTEASVARMAGAKHQVIYNDEDFNIFQTAAKSHLASFDIPPLVRKNGSFFLHAFLDTRALSAKAKRPLELLGSSTASVHSVQLSRYILPKPEAVSLVGHKNPDNLNGNLSSDATGYPGTLVSDAVTQDSGKPWVHLPLVLSICLMSTPHSLSINSLFPQIVPLLKLTPQRTYLPLVYVNMAAVMTKDLVHITPATTTFKVKVSFSQITVGKLKFLAIVEEALKSMDSFGISEQDTDGVKSIFFDTSLVLLLTTITVSALHMIFDVMAFKNDVTFWRKIENFEGISVRAIGWRASSQMVILLYLYDNDTSRLVLLSNFVSTAIEMWKLTKAMKVTIKWKGFMPVGFNFGTSSDAEKHTAEIDSQGMRLLSYILWPLSFSGAIYSLYYQPHKGWYSWCIASLANGVYAFGFLLMLPQLFLNYRLKSVAHLPWRVFMYKAFNTFIDDLFAFIIHMPTAHRVACFRDDAVFLIFLYQRWLYPVDKNRRNEFGECFGEKEIEQSSRQIRKESKKRK